VEKLTHAARPHILIAFLITALTANGVIITAYFNGGLATELYSTLDRAVVDQRSRGAGRPNPVAEAVRAGYQAVILALSDQSLVTGIANLVSIFLQYCAISSFSFGLGSILAYFSSTFHLLTLSSLWSEDGSARFGPC
jgi:hypothetical protein